MRYPASAIFIPCKCSAVSCQWRISANDDGISDRGEHVNVRDIITESEASFVAAAKKSAAASR